VNTVVVHDGLLLGSTTDTAGVLGPLKKKIDLKGKTVAVIGAGGAARAAALALHRKGSKVVVLARDPDKAAFVAGAVGCASGDLAELRRHTWDVLINATPVGSSVVPNESCVPAGLHRPGTVVMDMVYEPLETRLLREAQAAGCTIVDGLQMLLAQAAGQFEAWTGIEAPLDVMKATALVLAQEQEP
jgi:shikimate dehydrogenase